MQHVIEADTGRIIEVCAQGSDTSRFKEPDYLVITDAAAHDPATERWDAEAKAFVSIPEAELLARAKKERYRQLSDDYAAYLAQRGYNLAWRDSAREARDIFRRVLDDPNATTEQKAAAQQGIDRLNALSQWMMGTVRGYFQTVGQGIFAATTLAELEAVSWDFRQHDASDPGVSLGGEIFPLLDQATGAAG